jgi:hypothetical protein
MQDLFTLEDVKSISKCCSEYKFVHWLESNRNFDTNDNWGILCRNPNAIHLIEKHFSDLKWFDVYQNPNASHLIEKHIGDNIPYHYKDVLMANPGAFHLARKILQERDFLSSYLLSSNPSPEAISILEHHHTSYFEELCKNPNAIHIVEKNPKKLRNMDCPWFIYKNPNALHLLDMNNLDCCNIPYLCENPNAVHLIEKLIVERPYDVDWESIFENPNALHLIRKRIEMTGQIYSSLYSNPSIFELEPMNKHIYNILKNLD